MCSDMRDHLEMFATEEDLENASLYEPSSFVGVVFMDSSAMSYRLRFPYSHLPQPSAYAESFGNVECISFYFTFLCCKFFRLTVLCFFEGY